MKLKNILEMKSIADLIQSENLTEQQIRDLCKTQLCMLKAHSYGVEYVIFSDIPAHITIAQWDTLIRKSFDRDILKFIGQFLNMVGEHYVLQRAEQDEIEFMLQAYQTSRFNVWTWKQWVDFISDLARNHKKRSSDTDFDDDRPTKPVNENRLLDQDQYDARRKQIDQLKIMLDNKVKTNLVYGFFDGVEIYVITDVPNTITPQQERQLWEMSFTELEIHEMEINSMGFGRISPARWQRIKHVEDYTADNGVNVMTWKQFIPIVKNNMNYQENGNDFEKD